MARPGLVETKTPATIQPPTVPFVFGRDLENLPDKIQEFDLSDLAQYRRQEAPTERDGFTNYRKSVTSEVFGVADSYLSFGLNLTRKLLITI